MDSRSRPLARSSLAVAGGVVMLYLAAIVPSGRLALLCAASVWAAFIRMSCSVRWAVGCFAVTAAAAFLLLPAKSMAILYAAFFGYYPLIRLETERIKSKAFRWGVRFLLFNAVLILLYYLAETLFTELPLQLTGSPLLLLLIGNAAFLAYDFALQQLILYYIRTMARRIK